MAAKGPGWRVVQSLALELDVVLNTLNGYFLSEGLPDGYLALIKKLPGEWLVELNDLLGTQKGFITLFDTAATLAGSLFEADYARATLPLRDLTSRQVFDLLAAQVGAEPLQPDDVPQAISDLSVQAARACYRRVGIELADSDRPLQQERIHINRLLPVLKDGELHSRFWMWMDRFVYEFYLPWRAGQKTRLDLEQKRAETALGALEGFEEAPNLGWLNQHNPLLRYPELNRVVQAGSEWVYFWVEPFGLEDVVSIGPDFLLVSFAESGLLYQNFQAYAERVAARTQALADPTRLAILRMIRHFGMVNTEIAQYLGISRPTVSVHAKILREAGLIESVQDGRLVRHKIVPGEIQRLFHDLQHFLDLLDEA